METIKEVIMTRDGMSEDETDALISEARSAIKADMDAGLDPEEGLAEWFGLEPDYIFDEQLNLWD